jgi:hypothetical protein
MKTDRFSLSSVTSGLWYFSTEIVKFSNFTAWALERSLKFENVEKYRTIVLLTITLFKKCKFQ